MTIAKLPNKQTMQRDSLHRRKVTGRGSTDSRSTNPVDYEQAPRPVGAMPKSFIDGESTGWHRHRRGQVLFAVRGAMRVQTERQRWVIPSYQALWVPPALSHVVTMRGLVEMRTLYIRADRCGNLPERPEALVMTALMREMILRAVEAPVLYDSEGVDGLLMELMLAELARLPTLPISVPMPDGGPLLVECEQMIERIDFSLSPGALAERCHLSERTLARRFIQETGLTFGQWRQRARLSEAIQQLAQGRSVTTVALDLGYETPSAFSAMFRRAMGAKPSSFRPAGKGT